MPELKNEESVAFAVIKKARRSRACYKRNLFKLLSCHRVYTT